ncbi:hypothetical protein ABT093_21800 [Kitasatospora sp. NPDC002551]|uniref:hypothetical protein n=1 Tax=Kitasatospora sp. NPDC002551 TaxID=3154539 RepID=UPI00332EE1CA
MAFFVVSGLAYGLVGQSADVASPPPGTGSGDRPPLPTATYPTFAPTTAGARPAACTGAAWSLIVSVKFGVAIGMAKDDLSADNPVGLGGASEFGRVSAPGPFGTTMYGACDEHGPRLTSDRTGPVRLGSEDRASASGFWHVQPAAGGTGYTMRDVVTGRCPRANGVNAAVTMAECRPDDPAQLWSFSAG